MMASGHSSEISPDRRDILKWDLRNSNGAGPIIMNVGATILALSVSDRYGKLADVTFGFDSAADYLADSSYFGAVVGRYANRIARGKFTLGGAQFSLPINNGLNHLHGGKVGFDKRVWSGEPVTTIDGRGCRLRLVSDDGDQGYPGRVIVSTTYVWTADNRLIIDFDATTNAPTPFNIAQHTYWNLAGADKVRTVLDHWLMIPAEKFTPIDSGQIPSGLMLDVHGTPFDFRQAKPIGRDIDREDQQLAYGKGFDHNWVLNGIGMKLAAILVDPQSGRRMIVRTDQPGLQFYSGNFLNGTLSGKGGNAYPIRSAVALETQHFPDSPNNAGFPDTILKPGQPFKSRTIYAFDTVPASQSAEADR